MSVSEKEKLTHYLGDFEERHAYVDSPCTLMSNTAHSLCMDHKIIR